MNEIFGFTKSPETAVHVFAVLQGREFSHTYPTKPGNVFEIIDSKVPRLEGI